MRLIFVTLLGTLALASPASAKYLHLSEGKAGAQRYTRIAADITTFSYELGSCWHAGPHIVQCSMTEDARYSGKAEVVAVIALRGDKLYGHLRPGATGPVRPRFIGKLR